MVMMARQRGSLHGLVRVAGTPSHLGVRALRCGRFLWLLVVFHALPAQVVYCQTPVKSLLAPAPASTPAQQAPSTAPAAPAPPPNQAIPLPQVADRAEELDTLLRAITDQLTPAAELLESERAAKAQAEEISKRLPLVDNLLTGMPNVLELREEDLYWRSLGQQYAAQRKLLKTRAATLEEQIRLLDGQQMQWQATSDQIHETQGIEAVVDRIRQELEAIQATRLQAKEQLNLILTLQNQVSQQDQQIAKVLASLAGAQESLRGRVLERDSRPLWQARELRKLDQSMSTMMHWSAHREYANAGDFLRAKKLGVLGVMVLYLLGLLGAFKLKRYIGSRPQPGVPAETLEVFARPFSVALLVALLGMVGKITLVPNSIAFVASLACLILALRLLPPLIEPDVRPLVYTLVGFILLSGARELSPLPPVLKRELFALTVLAALVIFAWLVRPARLRQLRVPTRKLRLLVAGVRVGLVLLAVSCVANVFGFLTLSQVLTRAALLGALTAAGYYAAARVLILILITLLHSEWARPLPEARRETIERWSWRVLALGACLLWLRSESYLLTIHDSVVEAVSGALRYRIGLETVHFTLGSILSVLLVLLLGYAFANAFTFVLQKLLLSRLPLQRGMPYAISKVTYYVLLVLVFLVALADAGVELNKLTVVTGALGIGVGFGLQNVVNNFVSGLILLFERPIRVGDTVDVGGLVGMVKRIGARSSTVVTAQDSEVIVPNSNLISNQVINWTLSSPHRRAEIQVGVAYGTDPEQVLRLLVEAAESNPAVMRYPKPTAFFLGFGDSALNFELRFWASQDTWFQLKSDVTIGVAKTLQEAGIEIPFPQRDLHVRSIDTAVKEVLAPNDSLGVSSVHTAGPQAAQLAPQEVVHRGRGEEE